MSIGAKLRQEEFDWEVRSGSMEQGFHWSLGRAVGDVEQGGGDVEEWEEEAKEVWREV